MPGCRTTLFVLLLGVWGVTGSRSCAQPAPPPPPAPEPASQRQAPASQGQGGQGERAREEDRIETDRDSFTEATGRDNAGASHEAAFVDEAGRVLVRPRVLKDLASFARLWDRNLKEQGFVEAARAAARAAG